MTIRIVAQFHDANAAANVVGAEVFVETKTFDVECEELEIFLSKGSISLCHSQIIGGNILEKKTP